MALYALATPDDLLDRNISIPDEMDTLALLGSASDAIRDAAGCAITQTESTIVLIAESYRCLDLPFGPVQSVSSVQVADVEVTGWVKLGDTLIMPSGWVRCLPVEVTVTYTHGYPVIPADIVDLTCAIAAMAVEQGYGAPGATTSIKLGNYAEGFANPDAVESPSPLALPDSVRYRLQARFGASVAAIGQR